MWSEKRGHVTKIKNPCLATSTSCQKSAVSAVSADFYGGLKKENVGKKDDKTDTIVQARAI